MRKIHLYLSLPFGILLTLICFSGAMLVFEKEITCLTHPQRFQVEDTAKEPLPLDTLIRMVGKTIPDSVKIVSIAITNDPKATYQFNLSQPRKASLIVNPYTGEVISQGGKTPFFQTMFKLHRWLLGPAKNADGSIGWGKWLVGTSTLVFIGVLISGYALWWPRSRKALRNSLKIPFKKGLRPFSRGLHVAGGVYTGIFLLVMSITGLTWSFEWYRDGFYRLLGDNHHPQKTIPSQSKDKNRKNAPKEPPRTKNTKTEYHWQKVYDEMLALCPDFKKMTISSGSVSVQYDKWGNQRAADKYETDKSSGNIKKITSDSNTQPTNHLRGWVYTIHTGGFGGHFTRSLWFVSALVGALLPLTGYYLWWKRIRNRNKKKKTKIKEKKN